MQRLLASIPILFFAASAATVGARAQQQPNPREGERLARQWCASCHLVARDQQVPAPDVAPPFASVAARPQASAGVLRVTIQMPYPRMPQIALSRDETEHIIAYILSLKQR
jgi:mono/diheme cytochrome c family protein